MLALSAGLVLGGFMLLGTLFTPGKAHALTLQLVVVDRTTIRIQNPQVSLADYDSLDSDTKRNLSQIGIDNRDELERYLQELYNGVEAKDGDIWDDQEEFEFKTGNCTTDLNGIEPGSRTADVILRFPISGSSQCGVLDRDNLTLTNPQNITLAFRWVDLGTIEPIAGGSVSGVFLQDPNNPNRFLRQSETGDDCQDYIDVTPNAQIPQYGGGQFFQLQGSNGNCRNTGISDIHVLIAATENRSIPAGQGTASQSGSNAPSCESEGGALSWILCPLLGLADSILRQLDLAILHLLSVPDAYYNNPELETAWGRFRNLAYMILIPIILVMVIGTALSFEFVSAYTVKRAMPRLVVAVVFIALSFEITKFLIIFTNDVGRGIAGLVIGAFTGDAANITISSLFQPDWIDSALAGGAIVGGAAAWLVIGSIGAFFSLLLVGVAGLLIGFVLLSFRQFLIIGLMLLAPLAILAWIFPGNDKLWKLWWLTFSKLLMLFPLIMLLISVGRVFAQLVEDTPDGGLVSTFIKLVAYVGPYFLIPAMFKFAGGVFATITGMTNDRTRGLFDASKKYRQGQYAKGAHEFKTGAGRGRIRQMGWYRRAGMGVGVGMSGRLGFGRVGRDAMSLQGQSEIEQTLKNNGRLQQLANNDDANAVMAFSGGTRAGAVEAARDLFGDDEQRAQNAIDAAAAVGFTAANSRAALQTTAQNKSRAVGAGHIDTVQRGINRLARGNEQDAASMAFSYQYFSRGAGRSDLGGTWGTAGVQNRATALQTAARGRGVAIDQRQALAHATMLDGMGRADTSALVKGHGNQTQQALSTIGFTLDNGDDASRTEAAQRLLELQNAKTFGTAENQRLINEFLASRDLRPEGVEGPVDARGRPTTVNLAEQLAQRVNAGALPGADPDFRVTGSQLNAGARVYDREQGRDAMYRGEEE